MIQELSGVWLSGLYSLEDLMLMDNEITRVQEEIFITNKNITRLNLAGNQGRLQRSKFNYFAKQMGLCLALGFLLIPVCLRVYLKTKSDSKIFDPNNKLNGFNSNLLIKKKKILKFIFGIPKLPLCCS